MVDTDYEVEDIRQRACEVMGIPREELLSNKLEPKVYARTMITGFLYYWGNYSVTELRDSLSGDHSLEISNIKRFNNLMVTNSRFRTKFYEMIDGLNNPEIKSFFQTLTTSKENLEIFRKRVKGAFYGDCHILPKDHPSGAAFHIPIRGLYIYLLNGQWRATHSTDKGDKNYFEMMFEKISATSSQGHKVMLVQPDVLLLKSTIDMISEYELILNI